MSLVADYGTSSSESESDDDSEQTDDPSSSEKSKSLPKLELGKLPKPHFDGVEDTQISSSVFKNPFKEAEMAKTAILEKHVKMVDTQGNVKVINGRKICWNYRKGRCRFGHNCKYAHDSDLQKSKEDLEKEKETEQTVVCQNKQLPQPSLEELKQIQEEAITLNKKKRPGLAQGLVPGKKVMKMYFEQHSKN